MRRQAIRTDDRQIPADAGCTPFPGQIDAEIAQYMEANDRVILLHVRVDSLAELPRLVGQGVSEAVTRLVIERVQSVFCATRVFHTGDRDFIALSKNPPGFDEESMHAAYLVEGQVLDLPCWIGYAEIDGSARTFDVLSRRAELAMGAAKVRDARCPIAFEAEFGQLAGERHATEAELRKAMQLCEFELHYQPQYDIRSASITGFEALMRWRSPKHGLVSPGAFIPALERFGLISAVGEWAIRRSCAEAAGWPTDLSVAVNVSAAQLSSPTLLPAVVAALAHANLSPERLELEVTESCLIEDTERTLTTLRQLRAIGVRLSLDDFGTGYSSLSHLRRFPFHKIKIDQSFIREASAEDALLKAIVEVGRALTMTTIAEGVETIEQLAIVARSGCPAAQGFLISRPLESDRVAGFLADADARTYLRQWA